jgi:hypothetical protein
MAGAFDGCCDGEVWCEMSEVGRSSGDTRVDEGAAR